MFLVQETQVIFFRCTVRVCKKTLDLEMLSLRTYFTEKFKIKENKINIIPKLFYLIIIELVHELRGGLKQICQF